MHTRADLRAGGHGHQMAVAGLHGLLGGKIQRIGVVAAAHGDVVLVVAGGEDNALLGRELDVLAVLVPADNADDLPALFHELHGGRLIVEVDLVLVGFAERLHGGNHLAREERAFQIAVAVLVDVVLAVALLIGVEAGLVQFGNKPVHRFLGAIHVALPELRVVPVIVELVVKVDVLPHADLGGLLLDDLGAQMALGDDHGLLLQHGNGCAALIGGDGRGHACGPGADDNDVVLMLFGKRRDFVRDDRGLRDHGIKILRERGGLLRMSLHLRERLAGQGETERCGGARLQKASSVHFHRNSPRFRFWVAHNSFAAFIIPGLWTFGKL